VFHVNGYAGAHAGLRCAEQGIFFEMFTLEAIPALKEQKTFQKGSTWTKMSREYHAYLLILWRCMWLKQPQAYKGGFNSNVAKPDIISTRKTVLCPSKSQSSSHSYPPRHDGVSVLILKDNDSKSRDKAIVTRVHITEANNINFRASKHMVSRQYNTSKMINIHS
jgi:hypothetical protein